MGFIEIDTADMRLPLKNIIEPRYRLDIYDESSDDYMRTITGGFANGGTVSIAADSDIRWTVNISVIPNRQYDIKIEEYNLLWIDKKAKLYLGLYDRLKDDTNWYPFGEYVFTQGSWTYDATNNTLSLSMSDMVSNLNGQRNGVYGPLNTVFPAYYDTQYYSNSVTYVDGVYSCTISKYKGHFDTGDIFCLKMPETNTGAVKIKVNSNNAIPVYSKLVEQEVEAGDLEKDIEYLFQVMYNPRTNTKYFTVLGVCEDTNIVDEGTSDEVTFYLTYHRIRDVVISVLRQLALMKEEDYVVDDIGEYKAMPGYGKTAWEEYREESPLWNAVPFDQEFGVGSNIWQIITTFRNLYPNYESYFDKDGVFRLNMIPDCSNDPVNMFNDYIQKILISENYTLDLTTVRNVNLVYGQSIETEFFADSEVTYANETYSATITGYKGGYKNGDLIALRIPESNTGKCYIKIGKNKKIAIYDDNLEKPFGKDLPTIEEKYANGEITEDVYIREKRRHQMDADTIYVFKIKKKRENQKDIVRAYLLGHWQAAGLCALVNGRVNEEMYTTFDGRQVPMYSEEFFMDVYNVERVQLVSVPDSPYTCEKIGVRLAVWSGGEFENIDSDSDAIERARWETWKSARLTDNMSITTKLVPFINDVNFVAQYKPSDEEIPHAYLVKSISHDFSGGTTSWTMIRFYDYYIPDENTVTPETYGDYYNWNIVSVYNWAELEPYTWEELYSN